MANYARVKSWGSTEVLTAAYLNAEFDNVINNTKFAGTYADPIIVGTYRIWHDTTTGCLRTKTSAPSSVTDGNILMEG